MKNSVTALLLTAVSAGTNLRHLNEELDMMVDLGDGQGWWPGRCADFADKDQRCAIQDDGYWFLDDEGNWTHFTFAKRKVEGTRLINDEKRMGYESQSRNGDWTFIPFEKREGDGGYWMNDMEG